MTPPVQPPEAEAPNSAPAESWSILPGFAIILAFNLAGNLLAETCVPLPGPVIGLGLLAIGLFSGLIHIRWVEQGAGMLLKNMMLFFVPALVGSVDLLPGLGPHWVGFLLAIVLSFLVVLFVTGGTAALLKRRGNPSNPPP